jgi:hypothetical protein
MRYISRSTLIATVAALALFSFASLAYADSESISGCAKCNGYSFTAAINQIGITEQYQVVYTITNNSGPAANPYNWSLTVFDTGNAVSSPTTPTVTLTNSDGTLGKGYTGDYTAYAGKSNNGNGKCNGTIGDALCVQETGTGPVLQQGQALTFTFDLTCSNCRLMSNWDFLASGNPPTGAGNVYAITNWGNPVSMPEPSVLVLYGSTLAVGLVFAWRKRPFRPSNKT